MLANNFAPTLRYTPIGEGASQIWGSFSGGF